MVRPEGPSLEHDMNIPLDIDQVSVDNGGLLSGVAYCVSGTLDSKILSKLGEAGASRKWSCVSATHYIAAPDADELKLDEARGIFEVPVVVPDWVVLSLKLKKKLPITGFERHNKQLFSKLVFATSGIKGKDLESLWALVTYHGGQFRSTLTNRVTHLITNECKGKKYAHAVNRGNSVKIVCSDWITECISKGATVDESRFGPQYLVVPHMNVRPVVVQSENINVTPDPSSNNGQIRQVVPSSSQSLATPNLPQNSPRPTVSMPTHVIHNQMQHQQNAVRHPAQPLTRMRLPIQPNPGNYQHPKPQGSTPPIPINTHQMHAVRTSVPDLMHSQLNTGQPSSGGQPMMAGNQQGVSVPSSVPQNHPQGIKQFPLMSPTGQPAQSPNMQIQQNNMLQQSQSAQMAGKQMGHPPLQNQLLKQMQSPPHQHQQMLSHPSQVNHSPQQGTNSPQMGVPSPQIPSHQQMTQSPQQLHHAVSPQHPGQSPQQIQPPQHSMSPQSNSSMMAHSQTMHHSSQLQNQGIQQNLNQQNLNHQNQIVMQNTMQHMSPQGMQNQMGPNISNQPTTMIQNQMIQQPMQNKNVQPGMMTNHNQMGQLISNQNNHQMSSQTQAHQFQAGQMSYSNQNLQQIQFQNNPMKSNSPQYSSMPQQHMMAGSQQTQVRMSMQSPQGNQQQPIHYQVLQQGGNRPGIMRGQFTSMSPGPPNSQPSSMTMGQQGMFRQQQPQGQVQLFHPVPQQRLQSPTGQQQLPQQNSQIQGQMPQFNQQQLQHNQMSQQGQQYNVVVNQQPYGQNQQIQGHPQHGTQPMPSPQQHPQQRMQKVQFQARSGAPWTHQQQLEVVKQIQLDPQIRQQWVRMDNQQRSLLIQKLLQQNSEEMLRREMMLRQQHMSQNASTTHQNQPPQGSPVPPSTSSGVSNVNVVSQAAITQSSGGQNHSDAPMQPSQSHPPMMNPTSIASTPQMSAGSNQMPINAHSQLMMQNHQELQKSHMHSNTAIPPHPQGSTVPQQKLINSQISPSGPQKFLTPAPVQNCQAGHGVIGTSQPNQATGVVRTQQIFTPQLPQQQQQQRVNIRRVLIHQGQRQPVVLQHQQSSPQKISMVPQQNQLASPGNSQWASSQPRPSTGPPPGAANSQFPNARLPMSEQQQSSSPQSWNVRPHVPSPQSPGNQSSMPMVQVVNSKTKTALANLLSNRLQGNNVPESNAPTTALLTTSTTTTTSQTMCPPPPPTVTSQSLPNSAPATTQHNVNSFGSPRVSASPALPVSPSRTQFFGHDPQVKLPPDAYFLGCVFWAAEPVQQNEWRNVIEEHGGQVTDTYTPNVTHVICETQKFPEFQTVMRDGKRVVTLYWINDVHERKIMTPPFNALHLPVPFTENEQPMRGYIMGYTGFREKERLRIKEMIRRLGGTPTSYFTQKNDCLVCHIKSDGMKYQKAREWKKPVVSAQFLNEVYLGHYSSIQMIHSPKYQNFTVEQPLRLDIQLCPLLLAAWKTPIRVTTDEIENFKSMKRAAENGLENKPKRIKLDLDVKEIDTEPLSPEPGIKREVVEDSETDSETLLPEKRPPSVIISGFTRAYKEKIKEKVEKLGGKVTDDFSQATHLLLKDNFVTTKLFLALCELNYIVNIEWLHESGEKGKFVEEQKYMARHEPFEKQYGNTIADVLAKPGRRYLFKGITFYLTPGEWPLKRDVTRIIEAAGGQIDRYCKSLREMRDFCSKFPRRSVLITCPDDFKIWEAFLCAARRPHVMNVYEDKFIWWCIATQKVKLKVPPPPVSNESTELAELPVRTS